jgi:hypothetical protein
VRQAAGGDAVSEHTPGPLMLCGCDGGASGDQRWIHLCPLHTAAPDLLAALEPMTNAVRAYLVEVSRAPNNRSDEVIDAAARALVDSVPIGVAAIAKAKGERDG